CNDTFDHQSMDFWLPLIAAYTGARREEIGQLTVDNIRVVGNMHVMDITDLDPDQKIKNKHSLRSIWAGRGCLWIFSACPRSQC
ncbi:hypothetical protein, partial [Sulfitobacter sp.]|uniref:hypothetical protein n=1 Tax=Sulfitobacter sp. TaxID=1903071 RepID=UPI0035665FE7